MIWLLARREIVTRARTRAFRILTAVLFLAVIALATLPQLFAGGDDDRDVDVGVVAASERLVDTIAAGGDGLVVTTVELDSTDIDAALDDGDVDVVVTPDEIVWEGRPDLELDDFVRAAVQQAALLDRAEALDLSAGDVGELLSPVELTERRLDGDGSADGVRFAAGFAAGIATFIGLQMWGSFIMMGVIEEKSSRVVEVLLAQVRPVTLLAGKVIGLSVLALGQMIIVVIGIVVGLVVVQDVDVPSGVWATVPLLLATFIGGLAFYATAFAAVGSMVSRQEDAQGVALPVIFPLLAGYFAGSASLTTPDGPVMTIGSLLPITSPVMLPMRTALTDVPAWQIALSLALLAVAAVLMLRVAAWIYRFSLLRTGSRVRWGELWSGRGTEPTV